MGRSRTAASNAMTEGLVSPWALGISRVAWSFLKGQRSEWPLVTHFISWPSITFCFVPLTWMLWKINSLSCRTNVGKVLLYIFFCPPPPLGFVNDSVTKSIVALRLTLVVKASTCVSGESHANDLECSGKGKCTTKPSEVRGHLVAFKSYIYVNMCLYLYIDIYLYLSMSIYQEWKWRELVNLLKNPYKFLVSVIH